MVPYPATEPKDPTPQQWPRHAGTGTASIQYQPEFVDPDGIGHSSTDSGTLTAIRRAIEQRLHWPAQVAVLNALVCEFAPWEMIQHHAQIGVGPLTAVAGICTGWKILFVGLPRLYRRLAEHGIHFELRLSIGRRRQGTPPTTAPTAVIPNYEEAEAEHN
ncbi:hypothetical protein [Nocardia salmonicida]|uniref:hypothetical protein n=1 Tax=Nocardia salmonicida TaxID=53431 RepID=UPI0037A1257D